jgi:hypothetical protein
MTLFAPASVRKSGKAESLLAGFDAFLAKFYGGARRKYDDIAPLGLSFDVSPDNQSYIRPDNLCLHVVREILGQARTLENRLAVYFFRHPHDSTPVFLIFRRKSVARENYALLATRHKTQCNHTIQHFVAVKPRVEQSSCSVCTEACA